MFYFYMNKYYALFDSVYNTRVLDVIVVLFVYAM